MLVTAMQTEAPPQIAWIRTDLTRHRIGTPRLDAELLASIGAQKPRNWVSSEKTCGISVTALGLQDAWSQRGDQPSGRAQLAYWQAKSLALVGNSGALHTAPIWTCHSRDAGMS